MKGATCLPDIWLFYYCLFIIIVVVFVINTTACKKTANGEDCSESDAIEKYKLPKETKDRNIAGDGKFILTVYNPVANTGMIDIVEIIVHSYWLLH